MRFLPGRRASQKRLLRKRTMGTETSLKPRPLLPELHYISQSVIRLQRKWPYNLRSAQSSDSNYRNCWPVKITLSGQRCYTVFLWVTARSYRWHCRRLEMWSVSPIMLVSWRNVINFFLCRNTFIDDVHHFIRWFCHHRKHREAF